MAANTFIRDAHVQPTITAPAPPSTLGAPIKFHHPGYTSRYSAFLYLPRVDFTGPGGTGTGGVHHGTALLACQVIADNAFHGRLYFDRAGQNPVNTPPDGILTHDAYYFIIPNNPQYPVVPTFRDWAFPHGQLPQSWPRPAPGVLPDRCALTKQNWGLKEAHVVPKEEATWFNRELMSQYGPTMRGIHDPVNLFHLRADIHKTYDSHDFVFVPKREIYNTANPIPQNSPISYVVHDLKGNDEFWYLHHNVPLQYMSPTCPEMHLTRFAWAVIFRVKPFLVQGQARFVVTVNSDGQREVDKIGGMTLLERYGGGGSRTTSPLSSRKRRKIQNESNDSMGEDEDADDRWDVESDSEEEYRGRQRCTKELVSSVLVSNLDVAQPRLLAEA